MLHAARCWWIINSCVQFVLTRIQRRMWQRVAGAHTTVTLVDGIVVADAVDFAQLTVRRRNSDAIRQKKLRLVMLTCIVAWIIRVRVQPARRVIRWGFGGSGSRVARPRVLMVWVVRQVLLVVPVELRLIVSVLVPDGLIEWALWWRQPGRHIRIWFQKVIVRRRAIFSHRSRFGCRWWRPAKCHIRIGYTATGANY